MLNSMIKCFLSLISAVHLHQHRYCKARKVFSLHLVKVEFQRPEHMKKKNDVQLLSLNAWINQKKYKAQSLKSKFPLETLVKFNKSNHLLTKQFPTSIHLWNLTSQSRQLSDSVSSRKVFITWVRRAMKKVTFGPTERSSRSSWKKCRRLAA